MSVRFAVFRRWLWCGVCVALLAAVSLLLWARVLKPWLYPPSPLVITPKLALEQPLSGRIYYNPAARAWLAEWRPDRVAAGEAGDEGRGRAFAQAVQKPALFRQLDRQGRFETVLLVGDPSEYARLLEHLIEPEVEKRDFRLVYLDHWALIFVRGAAREWVPGDAEPLRERLARVGAEDRAAFLAKTAVKMLAVKHLEAAKRWLDAALATDGDSVDALSGLAQYYLALGKWKEAESHADKALALEEAFLGALQAKLVALRAQDRKQEAFALSERLNKVLPEDPVRLQQHARTAHEAQQYAAAIEALRRLVALAEAEGRATGEYEFQLGDAHAYAAAADGAHAEFAATHFKRALLDPTLPPAMRKFAEERLATIRERAGIR